MYHQSPEMARKTVNSDGSPDAVLVFLLDPEHPQKFCLGILLLLLISYKTEFNGVNVKL